MSVAVQKQIVELASGNIGCVSVLCQLSTKATEHITMKRLKTLKTANIRGEYVWSLYRNVCSKHVHWMGRLLDDVEAKELTSEDLYMAAENGLHRKPPPETVQQRLATLRGSIPSNLKTNNLV